VRQFGLHVLGGVRPAERAAVGRWLSPAELDLFDRMHRADQRHGLGVVRTLRRAGVTDREVLVAGLLHDCGKGRTGLLPRIVHALGDAYCARLGRIGAMIPGMGPALERLERHPEISADLAAAAGCSPRTVELIRWQEAPRDPAFGRLLQQADEAN
jgi:hypothetical protein